MLTVVMVAILIIGLISVISLERNVRREAQERVNNDLRIVNQFYEEKLRILAESLEREVLLFLLVSFLILLLLVKIISSLPRYLSRGVILPRDSW